MLTISNLAASPGASQRLAEPPPERVAPTTETVKPEGASELAPEKTVSATGEADKARNDIDGQAGREFLSERGDTPETQLIPDARNPIIAASKSDLATLATASTEAEALQSAALQPDPTDTRAEDAPEDTGQFQANSARQQVLDGISALAPKEALGEEMDMMIPVPDAIPDRMPPTTRDP